VLSGISYQPNRTTLHTDSRLLPRSRRAWASWNYHRTAADSSEATLTYLLNRLQGFDEGYPLMVTLNKDAEIDPSMIIASMDYQHPVFNPATIAAQSRRTEISGVRNTSYCGAYWGYGFHEDGVRSAVEVCEALGITW
jgi:predicted NAD/FAD-binding protein